MKRITFIIALLAWAAVAGAAALKLPEGIALPQGADSPGVVTFYHESHVDAEKPDCTTCHPKMFPILKATPRTPIVHERFDKGESCASCHNGKKAFAVDEDCTSCHQS
jgi:c(7)-type cytochrome triheme protein